MSEGRPSRLADFWKARVYRIHHWAWVLVRPERCPPAKGYVKSPGETGAEEKGCKASRGEAGALHPQLEGCRESPRRQGRTLPRGCRDGTALPTS